MSNNHETKNAELLQAARKNSLQNAIAADELTNMKAVFGPYS
jgi:hypothetical protein